jgi:hypothetical protein
LQNKTRDKRANSERIIKKYNLERPISNEKILRDFEKLNIIIKTEIIKSVDVDDLISPVVRLILNASIP